MLRITYFLLFLTAGNLFAQDLELLQAVDEAQRQSPKLLKAAAQVDEADWKRVESLSVFLPKVDLGASHIFDYKYLLTDINFGGALTSVPAILPSNSATLNAQLPLFDGFASVDKYASSRTFAHAAKDEYEWTKFSLEREVVLSFYNALGAKVLRDVAEQNLKMLEDHLKDVKLFKSAGVSTNYDVLRVEVQVSEARSELLNAEDNVIIERNHLGQVLGHAEEEREPKGAMPVPELSLIQGLKKDNFEKSERLDLIASSLRVQGQSDFQRGASKYWFPKFYLFGQYQYYNNRNDHISDRSAYRSAYQYGIALSWNIFDGLASTSRSKESLAQTAQAEQGLVISQLKAHQDFDLWKRKYVYYCNVYQARIDDVEKSSESVRLAKEGRKVGARTNTDLLDAESELSRARAGVVHAQIGAIEALVNLELASGKSLFSLK